MTNLKQAVLDATDGGRKIFESLYKDSTEIFNNQTSKKHIKTRDEKTASTSFKNIGTAGSPLWIMTDFGTGVTLNAIDAYMKEKGLKYFNEALHMLATEYHVDYSLKASINIPEIKERPLNKDDEEGETKWETREFTEDEINLMGPTVTKEVLAQHKYYALAWYSRCKEGRVKIIKSTENYPIFLHDCGTFQKIYKPLEINKAFRFFTVGTKPQNFIFGLEEAKAELEKRKKWFKELPDSMPEDEARGVAGITENDKLPQIIICSGERDAMCIAGMGYVPVWFNSECAKKSNDDIDSLLKIAEKIYNVPDKDETGILQGRNLALDHIEIYTIELPEWLSTYKDARMRPCKDLRDFVELRPNKTEFSKLLNTALRAKFWEWKRSNKETKIEMSSLSLLYFLKLNGFCKYKDPFSKEIKIIRINGYTVTEYEPTLVRDFIRKKLHEQQVENGVIEAFINSKKTTKQLYDDLETVEIDFDDSDSNGRTLFFENVCCHITKKDNEDKKSGIEESQTPQSGKYVWDTKIIPHKFTRIEPAFTYNWINGTLQINLANNPSPVMRYLINTSRLYWQTEYEKLASTNAVPEEAALEDKQYKNENRFNLYGPRLADIEGAWLEQALSMLNKIYVIGYLMHHHKIACNAKAIWAMEWKNTEEGTSKGRSGKSLMFQCFEKLGVSEMVTLQGRQKKLTENNHFMERVSKSTDILLIDDADKSFDFDTFYTMITGSVTVNPKNDKSFELKYEDAPNIVFTSNFPIPNTDPSTMARILFVAFSDYYHTIGEDNNYKEEVKVSDEVGLLHGEGYSEENYNADINFFIDCLQFYLACQANGIKSIEPPKDSIMKRAQYKQMGEPFLRWAQEFFGREGDKLNHPLIRQAVYEDYCESIKRGEELKGAQGWMKSIKMYVRYCDDLECVNPENHPWYRQDRRISTTTSYKNKTKTYEMLYIKTVGHDELSTDIVTVV